MTALRVLAIASLMAVLGGCAVPPSVQLFSLAANGVSFLTAGKSAADVGISAVVQKDCSMLRVLRAESVCSETRTPAGDANSLVARALSSPLSRSTP